MPENTKINLRKKFDIAYFVATQKLTYGKYPAICDLEKQHGINVESTYLNENVMKNPF